ncbi:MAG: NAD-dependent epimerase/dehydratase family protein [Myxococcota bacterium]
MTSQKRIVIAGASGFIGQALSERLGDEFELVGLTRDSTRLEHDQQGNFEWVLCDLFSRKQTRDALEGADYAIYLVHSLTPSAALTQGNYRDMDLICADNFARACSTHDVEQVIYISGIMPENEDFSGHLASRLEVERTLGAYGTPVTTLRAGLIVGPGGSSTMMVIRLAERLPWMLCPKWTETVSQPIALRDVIELVEFVLGNADTYDEHYDIGGPDEMTYQEVLQTTADLLGKNPRMFSVPFLSPALSVLWIRLFSGISTALVRPLVESMSYEMITDDRRLQEAAGQEPTPFKEAMAHAVDVYKNNGEKLPVRTRKQATGARLVKYEPVNKVRSVQRLPLPPGQDATWVAREYARWLPRAMRPFLRVEVDDDGNMKFFISILPWWPLLELDYADVVSQTDRQLYWITGGLLAQEQDFGRLEFREVLGGRYVLAAIHDFKPRLPWWIYKATQAIVHLLVMHAYRRYLGRASEDLEQIEDETTNSDALESSEPKQLTAEDA